ncbi:GNAT family N-acetyltransferase [Gellertiella hungarica]|uniref:Ribosomal-protein-alanine N-acetyltransferase n=1 Tax=Gellertiella hungarica TaxID=1572859 RepID=A0A7W6JA89_9HYPH|nr:GNAT family N-acetyltransferase [Gellertiella hungarica]MBB4066726.1 ribosomal-protein-alanine N-acetyltransferase [Gellertiella hungarica]
MITLRNAREEDWELLAEIGLRAWDQALSRIGETAPMLVSARQAFRNFTLSSWLTITVVEKNGIAAGWASRERLDENITDFWIDPPYQRQGLGRALLNSVEAEMIVQGLDKAAVQTHARNNHAVAFFESQGYRISWLSVAYQPKVDRDVESVGLVKQLIPDDPEPYGPAG